MKNILLVILLFSYSFSKECYFNKSDNVCYYKYFDRDNIYKAKDSEEYYIMQNDRIYTFDKTIQVRFNSIGAIFTILNDYELEFVDKKKNEIYLFKVADRRDLFYTISKLNRLKTVMKAEPYQTRKYTNTYIERKLEAKRARLKAVLEKTEKKLENAKKNTKIDIKQNNKNIGFNIPDGDVKEKKSFLKGNLN